MQNKNCIGFFKNSKIPLEMAYRGRVKMEDLTGQNKGNVANEKGQRSNRHRTKMEYQIMSS
jgi:hypothetical protein